MSSRKRILKKRIMRDFPKLRAGTFRLASRPTAIYNCIAWAAGINDDWWEYKEGYAWPNAKRDPSVTAAVEVFIGLGYQDCGDNSELEPGWEKVAVYGDDHGYTHAARQLASGNWASKLGKGCDIEHKSLDGLLGDIYGVVKHVLRRRRISKGPVKT